MTASDRLCFAGSTQHLHLLDRGNGRGVIAKYQTGPFVAGKGVRGDAGLGQCLLHRIPGPKTVFRQSLPPLPVKNAFFVKPEDNTTQPALKTELPALGKKRDPAFPLLQGTIHVRQRQAQTGHDSHTGYGYPPSFLSHPITPFV